MGLLFLVAFALVPAGGIALIYLIVKKTSRPPPSTDPNPVPPSNSGETVAWFLVIAGVLAALFIWVIGSALATR